ncbi:hypothetical protein TruAng_003563 [Truncatella angustata]|nr:hypothetical protein TruAng_003563 [Truncatella angustata]
MPTQQSSTVRKTVSMRVEHSWKRVCPDGDKVARSTVHPEAHVEIGAGEVGSAAAYAYLTSALRTTGSSTNLARHLGGLILPSRSGYIVRSDVVSLRLVDCEPLEGATSFASPLQYFPENNLDEVNNSLPELLCSAAGGFFVREELSTGDPGAAFEAIQSELLDRLSFPWTLAELPSTRERTLVLVEGGGSKPEYDGNAARIYPAARALGLHIIVLDKPGHWLENGSYNDLRESFIPCELSADSQVLADNIVKALHAQKDRIGGIVSFFDEFQVGVAKAAQILSLPTLTPEAYTIATNKYETSAAAGRISYRGNTVEDALAISRREDLTLPLIVKPCSGWSSEGVFKVADRAELVDAVSQIDFKRHGTEFVVEEYCDGPEVDLNMIMYDGNLLFYEISDDYPKAAEGNGEMMVNTFIEMDSVAPSALPEAEQLVLRRTFHDLLVHNGLDFGVFHVEGRVKNSTMEYKTDSLGILDLHPRRSADDGSPKPSAFVLDINPRPPGTAAAIHPRITYGVDYHALSMLIALRDKTRVSSMAYPFRQRNQYWCIMTYIPTDFPPDRVGIFDSGDICEELKQRRPDLAKYISNCGCFVMRGDRVSHPGTGINTWVAYYNVFSRTSRRHALEIAKEVRKETRYEIL